METRAELFASARPLLFSIAYRMLGSVMDAEDLVQDAYLRWQEAPDVAHGMLAAVGQPETIREEIGIAY